MVLVLSHYVMSDSLDPQPSRVLFVCGIFQASILEWVAIFLLQGIFPTQGWNPRLLYLLHCKQILYPLSHQGKLEDVAKDSSWSPAKWLESPYSLVTRVQQFQSLSF